MLRSVDELQGREIRAADGDVGTIDQFFFDDENWTIRYLVVDTGNWLSGRKVLISPIALGHTDWAAEGLSVSLTKEQIKDSPGIDTDKPVSRQHESEIGHVEDFLIDDKSWVIRYIEVDTVNWWPGKKVVVLPQWITRVSWAQSTVYVNLARERIKNAPDDDPTAIVDRDYEDRLYNYYGGPKYWEDRPRGI